jgi:hypothetical protein
MHPPAQCVFDVSELFGLICSFVDKTDLYSLLTVSRRVFYCVAPIVWRDVSGLMALLGLFPTGESGKFRLDRFCVSALDLAFPVTCSYVRHTGPTAL